MGKSVPKKSNKRKKGKSMLRSFIKRGSIKVKKIFSKTPQKTLKIAANRKPKFKTQNLKSTHIFKRNKQRFVEPKHLPEPEFKRKPLAPEVEKVISEVSGSDVVILARALKGRENISEFKLAAEIHKEINMTRNMLYRLYHANLVSFTRKKDKQKGWYIYYWTFNPARIPDLIVELRKKRLESLHERLSREKKSQFYACNDRCVRLDFERSMDYSFKCPECGNLLNIEDNTELIQKIETEILQLKGESDKHKLHIDLEKHKLHQIVEKQKKGTEKPKRNIKKR